eukprot:TRINITY_DN33963_c0_g2_i1.p1 TRINITY_DN33963_c0_g2~~TRINITY_DN33963_c0_g2_i1.p1  ORF type:complete len:244 (+),score=30.37 TRINITY_DN33963_c0_g2_i1:568-1299(+)
MGSTTCCIITYRRSSIIVAYYRNELCLRQKLRAHDFYNRYSTAQFAFNCVQLAWLISAKVPVTGFLHDASFRLKRFYDLLMAFKFVADLALFKGAPTLGALMMPPIRADGADVGWSAVLRAMWGNNPMEKFTVKHVVPNLDDLPVDEIGVPKPLDDGVQIVKAEQIWNKLAPGNWNETVGSPSYRAWHTVEAYIREDIDHVYFPSLSGSEDDGEEKHYTHFWDMDINQEAAQAGGGEPADQDS